jgi:hypothetical protein
MAKALMQASLLCKQLKKGVNLQVVRRRSQFFVQRKVDPIPIYEPQAVLIYYQACELPFVEPE